MIRLELVATAEVLAMDRTLPVVTPEAVMVWAVFVVSVYVWVNWPVPEVMVRF